MQYYYNTTTMKNTSIPQQYTVNASGSLNKDLRGMPDSDTLAASDYTTGMQVKYNFISERNGQCVYWSVVEQNLTETLAQQFDEFVYIGLRKAQWDRTIYHYSEFVSSSGDVRVVQALYFDQITLLPKYTSSYSTDDPTNVYVTQYARY